MQINEDLAMQDSLKEYLEQLQKVELDREVLEEHVRQMTDSVIPAIEKDMRENERLAAELRYTPTSRLHRQD